MGRPVHKKLVLPGDIAARSSSLTLHVPRGYETGTKLIGVCHVCGMEFHQKGEEQAWQDHTVRCARRHIDEIRAMAPSEKHKGTVFDPETWDPEIDEHMRKVGQRMIAEGRLTVRKSERAGF